MGCSRVEIRTPCSFESNSYGLAGCFGRERLDEKITLDGVWSNNGAHVMYGVPRLSLVGSNQSSYAPEHLRGAAQRADLAFARHRSIVRPNQKRPVRDDQPHRRRLGTRRTQVAKTQAARRDVSQTKGEPAGHPRPAAWPGNQSAVRQLSTQPAIGIPDKICPGKEFASRSVWLAAANILAVFDIRKAREEAGREVTYPDLDRRHHSLSDLDHTRTLLDPVEDTLLFPHLIHGLLDAAAESSDGEGHVEGRAWHAVGRRARREGVVPRHAAPRVPSGVGEATTGAARSSVKGSPPRRPSWGGG
ncbi:uncharacterized protein B0H18DRAFT_582604 [Fomitopsis serialis]|uniref:uncharacterized protein n=1 Tax=Fomitopsis serialis TaxID=139415 RepID=UPI0020080F3A|nr:uncharacterized protein B0H18DRAFT_582604 [Neoantrodia serialis]KAH9920773.1 hypothetical protein B0H18DRAFT_582604 [Neoantrodia serialis]